MKTEDYGQLGILDEKFGGCMVISFSESSLIPFGLWGEVACGEREWGRCLII